MLSWIRLSVTRPVGVSIFYFALMVVGVVAMRQLSIDLLPKVDVPWISITTVYDGVAPEEIETLVTRPIEQGVSTVENVARIEANSSEGLSRVQLQFAWGTNLDTSLDDVRMALDRVRVRLPEAADAPSIFKFDLASMPVLSLAVSGNAGQRDLKTLAEDDLSRALERIPGVASVDARGGRDREIRVELDAEKLAARGLGGAEVEEALRRENQNVSAGDMLARGRDVVIRTAGEFTSLEEISQTVIATKEGQPITVADVALVRDTIREIRGELWIDSAPGIELRVFKQSGANTVLVVEKVREALVELNERHSPRARVSVLWDSSVYIKNAVQSVQMSALLGAVLAVVVLLFFLGSLRATLVVAIAIPISILATFAVIRFQGMTLNLISFGGLALGVGMLVDGAIVILENVYRLRSEGRPVREAVLTGTHEVALPVLAGTLTTVVVFAPVVFVGGFSGVLFSEMALVVTIALGCSLVVSLTLVPVLTDLLLNRPGRKKASELGRKDGVLGRINRAYGKLVRAAVTAPWAIVFAACALLGASVLLADSATLELMPESDEGRIDADIEFPVGTPLEVTIPLMQEAERRALSVLKPGELDHVVTSAGPEAWWRAGGGNEGEVELVLSPASRRERNILEIVPQVRAVLSDIPGAKLRVRATSSNILTRILRRGDDRLSVEISGHDLQTADNLAERVVDAMTSIPGVKNPRADRELGQLENVLHVDRKRAAEFGLGSADVAEAVERYVLGRVATLYRDRGDEFDVRVVLEESQRGQLTDLQTLPVVTTTGDRIALGTLVEVKQRAAPSSIARVDQQRTLRVNAGTSGRPLGDIAVDLEKKLAELQVPDGFSVRAGGELAEQGSAFSDLLVGVLLALFLVYSVMAMQFESLLQPLVIMTSVPFAFSGALVLLVVTGTSLNVYSFLGAIVLIGIVVNNAIVLVDTAGQLRREGHSSVEAVVLAGERRLRPILMTTATTLLGLFPLAWTGSEGSEMQVPLARVVVGGLLTSTLVTLVLVPAVYVIFERRRGEGVAGERTV